MTLTPGCRTHDHPKPSETESDAGNEEETENSKAVPVYQQFLKATNAESRKEILDGAQNIFHRIEDAECKMNNNPLGVNGLLPEVSCLLEGSRANVIDLSKLPPDQQLMLGYEPEEIEQGSVNKDGGQK